MSESKQQAWNAEHAAHPDVWQEPDALFAEEAAKLPVGTSLELGCGKGADSLWLASRGWRASCVDFAPAAIEAARKAAAQRGLTLDARVADGLTFKADRQYDLVYIGFVHLPPAQRRKLFANAARAVAPGGSFIYIGFAADNPVDRVPAPPEYRMMPQDIADCFPGFTLARGEVIGRRVPVRYNMHKMAVDEDGTIAVNTVIARLVRPAGQGEKKARPF